MCPIPRPTILIPAFQPDHHLSDLVTLLRHEGFDRILVVDDGSDSACRPVFQAAEAAGALVLRHATNLGKGRALKTGLNEALVRGLAENGIITADADGQHTVEDIARIGGAMAEHPGALVLGVRAFAGDVPLKSRIGNGLTRAAFSLIHGGRLRDTQTGLRGLPTRRLPLFLALAGERYEYEMNMLLEARPQGIPLVQVPIATIYIEGNRRSHYRPLQDSLRIFLLLLRFTASSLASAAVDYAVFALMHLLLPTTLLVDVVAARVASSAVNFQLNRRLVFRSTEKPAAAMVRYYALAAAILLAGYLLIRFLYLGLGLNVFLAKLISDVLLYTVSFLVQREFVYKRRRRP